MFEVLESTHDRDEAKEALHHLLFEKQSTPDTIDLSLSRAEEYFDTRDLLDTVAKQELPTLYTRHRCDISFPDVLTNWEGDFREATDDIYDIAEGRNHPDADAVQAYQEEMRARLPSRIPLVRGVDTTNPTKHPLTSWSAKAGTARLYGDYILYTTAHPEDVFMCALHGERIGEQEFVLTDYTIEEVYDSTTEAQVKIYQRMYDELR